MTHALVVSNLTKSFGDLTAVNNISFEVLKGSCFGLLGPNGAGKTTTLEILEGINQATTGAVKYPMLNSDSNNQSKLQSHIGIQFQNTALQDHIRVIETLEMFADLYHDRSKIEELIQLCRLEEYLDRDTKKLSGGQRQRLLLALALLHDPEIIFLDEPTTGLDPQARRNFWDLVTSIKERGKTLILTTHYMDEAHQLCDEIAIMDHGNIIEQGSPSDLLNQHFDGTFIRFPENAIQQSPDISYESISQHFESITQQKEHIEIVSQQVDKDLKSLINLNVSLEGLYIHQPNLDDLFLKLTGHELRE